MSESVLRFIERRAEFIPKDHAKLLPRMLRGFYVLYSHHLDGGRDKYNVQYIGMAAAGRRGGLRGRLLSHARSKRKKNRWTHFSAFKVWDNIRDEEVAELEGIFRHIYRKDSKASSLNIQRGFKKLRRVQQMDLSKRHSGRTR